MSQAKRADLLLVERGFYESRARAQAAIAAGLVRVNGEALTKPRVLLMPRQPSKRKLSILMFRAVA